MHCALCCTAVRRIDDDQDPIKNLTNHMSRKLIFLVFSSFFLIVLGIFFQFNFCLLHLIVRSRDLSQAEKKIILCKVEQIHKITLYINCPGSIKLSF